MKRAPIKKRALVHTNPYLADPAMRRHLTVLSVNDGNRMEGIQVSMAKTQEHYDALQREADCGGCC